MGDRYTQTYDLNNLGAIHGLLAEPQKALEYYDKALTLRRAVGDQYGESYTLIGLGAVYIQLGNQPKALVFQSSISLIASCRRPAGRGFNLYQLAKPGRSRGNFIEARSQIEAALDIVESTRTKVSLADVRATYFCLTTGFL